MTDTLILRDVAAECRLGVEEWERENPQPVWFDVELAVDAARAAARDEMRDAVDYARLVEGLRKMAQERPVNLLETLAEKAASFILKEFGNRRVTVRVKKKALPGVGYAAVEVTRAGRRRRVARTGRPPARVRVGA